MAVSYSQKWALDANPDFYHFGGVGGDCTNFVSQCLLAGGAEMIHSLDGWFYYSKDDRSPSWTSVEEIRNFLLNDNKGICASICNLELLEVGDIIQLRQNEIRFNHSLIVSRKTKNDIYVCAHSNDVLDKNLKEYYFIESLGLHIEGIR